MLFDKFLNQYIEDLIDCGDTEYELSEKDKKELIVDIECNDRLWETLDDIIYHYLKNYVKESEDND